MRDKKKAVFNILFLLLVFGLTVYGVFRGEDLESMMHSIRQAQWQWLVPGVALVLFFIWAESIIVWNPVEETVLLSVFFRWFFL